MNFNTWYTCNIMLTNGKSSLVISGNQRTEEFISYQKYFEKVNQEIANYLAKRNLTEKDVKKITIEIDYPSEEELFFHDLLGETQEAFKNSATNNKYPDENWNFAICDTPIQKGKGLFFGLNWGGDNIKAQTIYPQKHKDRSWGFITNSRPYFKEYLKEDIEDLNYSNLCFFRSPNMNHFAPSDWELGLPLFQKYVEYINPKWTLMLGKPPAALKKYLSNLKTISILDKQKHKTITIKGYTGTLLNKYPFAGVPHPQAHISSETRHKIWDEVIKHINA